MVYLAVLLAAWLCFYIWTFKFVNIYRLYMLFGGKGSGKSSLLVKLAYKHLRKGWLVYTNMDELVLPGLRHIEIEHIGDFVPERHSLLLLDEVGMVWDARDYKAFRRPVRDFFKLQRHYHVKVYLASQKFDIDKKLRDLTDGMYLCEQVFRVWSVAKRIVVRPKVVEATAEAESRITDNLTICPVWNWELTWIPRWSQYFDSHAVPDVPLIPFTEPVPYDPSFYKHRALKKINSLFSLSRKASGS